MTVTFEQTVFSYPVTRRESARGRLPCVRVVTSPHPERLHTDAAFCPPSSSSCRVGPSNSFASIAYSRSVGRSVGVANVFQTPLDAGGGETTREDREVTRETLRSCPHLQNKSIDEQLGTVGLRKSIYSGQI